MDNKCQIGEKIRLMRKAKGLTQEQLAEKIGIDNKHLSRIEKGKHLPTYKVLKNLAQFLDFDIYNLEETSISEIIIPDKFHLKSLKILNSAKNDTEKQYYLEVLQLAQKGLTLKTFAE